MEILKSKKAFTEIKNMSPHYFDDMVKGVVDVKQEIIALNADMHVDLEQMLLDSGSCQDDLIGFNIYYEDGEVELDSNINPPINRKLGYPRAGRMITDPKTVALVETIIDRWIDFDV